MLDFTSALYLGLWHSSRSLNAWGRLTLGMPAALAEPPGAQSVAGRLAILQGSEGATLAASTLHLFWDLFGMLAQRHVAVYLDAGAYPIARWGVERAAARGTPVLHFAHRDPDALRRLLRLRSPDRQPVVMCDGICPCCGRVAPLAAYLDAVREEGGLLVLDDTQALGLLGHSPGPDAPYGRGGGGSLRWAGIGSSDSTGGVPPLVVASLAKGFGVPMAVLSASLDTIRWFQDESETRVHCSPPSVAVIRAAEHALALNATSGDAVRLRLAHRVDLFRQRLAQAGLAADGGLFPIQTLTLAPGLDVRALYERLLRLGVRAVLRNGDGSHISFIITARHLPGDIERAAEALAWAVRHEARPGLARMDSAMDRAAA